MNVLKGSSVSTVFDPCPISALISGIVFFSSLNSSRVMLRNKEMLSVDRQSRGYQHGPMFHPISVVSEMISTALSSLVC